ncbi:hypothetical protein DRJ16_06200 [Candidatus Woesearchaeota archaeon]|nr:MAG: hypothetical protein DRJ16_06200 [Candidatus Woesearchaeota archaeon]
MKDLKRVVAVVLVFTAGTVFAARPLAVDDAGVVDKGQLEVEIGARVVHDSACDAWEIPVGLTAGVLPNIAVGIGFGGQFEERSHIAGKDHESGLGDLVLGAKWGFLSETNWLPAQALSFSVKFPTADDDKGLGSGEIDYDLTWIASKMLTETVGLHVNAGYSWIGEPAGEEVGDIAHYGAALDAQLNETVQWVGEVFAEKELQGGTQTVVQYNTGFRWSASDALTLDLAAGSSLHGDDAPDFAATLGLTWAFGL